MSSTRHIRKSFVLVVSVAALVAPAAASAYPVIPDDPTTADAVAQGHAWYNARVKRAAQSKPTPSAKPHTVCPPSKKACRKP